MSIKVLIAILAILGLAFLFSVVEKNRAAPVTLSSSGFYLNKSIDNKIKEAQLIVIGEVKTTLPSRWNAPDGNDSRYASPQQVSRAQGLFTDSIISIHQTLKGDIGEPVVRVRSFIGEIATVRWVDEGQPLFITHQTYLLFLEKDTGASANVDPGDYVSVNAGMATYAILAGKAKSLDDEWELADLIAYIERSLSTETPMPTAIPGQQATETPFSPAPSPGPTVLPTQTPPPAAEISPTP